MKPKKRPISAYQYGATTGLILVILAYSYYSYELGPASSTSSPRPFMISMGESVPDIAAALAADHLIRDKNAFITYVTLHDIRSKLEAGTYSLSPDQPSQEIASIIASGQTLADHLTIPPGYTIAQIEELASEDGIASSDFQAALDAPHTQSFLASKPPGVSLEGYLFPDSYEISKTTTAAQLVNEMLDNFGQKVGPAYVQALQAEGLTLHQGLTIASIVEREVSNPADRPIVAQIFLSRLKLGMSLGSDMTAEYASGLLNQPFSTNVQSPYNTLINVGLPPGPICSPSLNSLDAVAHPAATSYLYFLTGKDGNTYYATTYAQHQANIAKYLN